MCKSGKLVYVSISSADRDGETMLKFSALPAGRCGQVLLSSRKVAHQ